MKTKFHRRDAEDAEQFGIAGDAFSTSVAGRRKNTPNHHKTLEPAVTAMFEEPMEK